MNQNPYHSPETGPPKLASVHFALRAVVCGLWAFLAGGAWFLKQQLVPLYEEFELALPLLTQVLVHPAAWLCLAAVAGFLGLSFSSRFQPKVGSSALVPLLGIAIVMLAVGFYAFFQPLVVLIKSVST